MTLYHDKIHHNFGDFWTKSSVRRFQIHHHASRYMFSGTSLRKEPRFPVNLSNKHDTTQMKEHLEDVETETFCWASGLKHSTTKQISKATFPTNARVPTNVVIWKWSFSWSSSDWSWRFQNNNWLTVTRQWLACKQRVEGVITATNSLVRRHLTIWLDAVFQAEQLPASIADLHTWSNETWAIDAGAVKTRCTNYTQVQTTPLLHKWHARRVRGLCWCFPACLASTTFY